MSRILVIEDIDENAILLKKLLRSRGYDVLWASNGESGLYLASSSIPDLILLDLGLPDIDGQTLVRYLRKVPKLVNVPIIVVTAWPEQTAKMIVDAYGCDGYIGKPIDIYQLFEIVKDHLPTD